MNRDFAPQDVLDAAHARSAARAERRWADADRLRDQIEAAGWRVIDRGVNFRLELAGRPDVVDDAGIRYGSSASVPSRLDEPTAYRASLVLIGSRDRPLTAPTLDAVLATRGERDEVVLVIDGPDGMAGPLPDPVPARSDLIRTAVPLGAGAALDIALRRVTGGVVVLLGPGLEPTGDLVGPLAAALEDPRVAIAGLAGYLTRDLRHLAERTTPGDATVIGGSVQAFRRDDARAAMPVDEGFVSHQHLDRWWSLALRAVAAPDGTGSPGRALVVADLPVRRRTDDGPNGASSGDARLERRNFYRVLKAFRDRADLLAEVVDG